MKRPKPVILDISEHQSPEKLNYGQLSQELDWVIIRVQYGSWHQDRFFETHLERFRAWNIPVNVYAWVRGIDESDMIQEAEDFYRRAKSYQPSFWWLDIEERTMGNMVKGCEVYRQRLKDLGAKKVGAYIANHRYQEFGFSSLATQKYDGIWLPTYGRNSGNYEGANPTATSVYDLHQYTSNGRLVGYNGPLDLSRLASAKSVDFFTGNDSINQSSYHLGERVQITGIYESSRSQVLLKPLRTQGRITKIISGVANPYLLDEGMGWVNESVMSKIGDHQYQVKPGDTLSEVAQGLGVSWQRLATLNQLANPDLIYPGQMLNY
ncbi:LysM peptidoglycan-binding domain-containing protein [Vagococcus sp. BWB3-3]|uniref:LysM peptidoglycan-binding domain-containing protein n=1 Tax=Vagococcus allomyrinae TaxID=2794353 RepID=A0A940P858_9ENTE|nr:GH25 family lysozyme [Vagococcus allomyrinae]MBP1042830.1 LysM peptidoglycan-binding domain-containing protein [Vagococcus allomyrinae]